MMTIILILIVFVFLFFWFLHNDIMRERKSKEQNNKIDADILRSFGRFAEAGEIYVYKRPNTVQSKTFIKKRKQNGIKKTNIH